MKKNNLDAYQMTKTKLIMLWLNNYEFGESLIAITEWVKFQSIDEFASRIVMSKEHNQDEYFQFKLNLNSNEEKILRDYLLKRKLCVMNHILNRKSFLPNTHLYQLYLQYLSDRLNDVEKSLLLDGYLHMIIDLQGDNCDNEIRLSLENHLNLR